MTTTAQASPIHQAHSGEQPASYPAVDSRLWPAGAQGPSFNGHIFLSGAWFSVMGNLQERVSGNLAPDSSQAPAQSTRRRVVHYQSFIRAACEGPFPLTVIAELKARFGRGRLLEALWLRAYRGSLS